MPTLTQTPTGSALNPICPPQFWWGDINILNDFDVTERIEYVVEMTILMFKGQELQKYAMQSYGSCALHFFSWCLTSV